VLLALHLGGCFDPIPATPDAALADTPAVDQGAPQDTTPEDVPAAVDSPVVPDVVQLEAAVDAPPSVDIALDTGTDAGTDTGTDLGRDAGRDTGTDAGVVCRQGTVACNGQCVDTRSDPEHCGRCGEVCTAGRLCAAGACVCPAGTVPCGSLCVRPQNDLNHCGGCRRQCPNRPNTARTCVDAACVATCAAPYLDCNNNTDDGCETDPRTTLLHCGACNRRCDVAQGLARCVAGACTVGGCNAGFGDCDRMVGNGCETDLNTNAQHCGACGNACAAGLVCVNGGCATQCLAPNTFCGVQRVCTRLQQSVAHCGSCGTACTAPTGYTALCEAGRCQQRCAPGLDGCDGRCVDLQTDSNNCGGCGLTCRRACVAGACPATTVCPPLNDYCPRLQRCVSLQNDPDACGGCDTVCPADNTCTTGRCTPCGAIGQPCCRDGRCTTGRCAGTTPTCTAD